MLSGINDPQMIQGWIIQSNAHRLCNVRCFVEFDFYRQAPALCQEEQINFCPTMRCPEKRFGWFKHLENLFQGKAFPGRSNAWMTYENVKVRKAQQAVEHPRVAQVDFWGFDLSFPNVLIPRLELADHKRPSKDIEVGTHRFIRQTHSAGQFRSIPDLPMIMGQHGPEATHRRCGNPDTQLWNVAFQEGTKKSLAPGQALLIRGSEE